jgi:predicted esterase
MITRQLDPEVMQIGAPLGNARLAMILLHGRGASAASILDLAAQFTPSDVAYLAPQAEGSTWYPHSFLRPIEENEPWLSAGLARIDQLVATLMDQGLPSARIGFLGFSQGACLGLEYAARHAQRYGAIVGLSGGLIGPPGTPRNYSGGFAGTPVFLGCSDVDAHIPLDRVHETTQVFRAMDAIVDERIYPAMGHLVNEDEIRAVNALLKKDLGGLLT